MANTNTVPQALFGPGVLYVTRTDIANATPTNIGYVNEFSMDMSFDSKELYGQKQFPLVVARGTAKCTGKIIAATLSGAALNAVLLGQSWTAATQYDIATTTPTAIPSTPYQITPTVPSSGTFDKDLGVLNSATAEPLTRVASSPTAGEYSINEGTGVYTFSSADEGSGISVIISYVYSFTSGATGQSMTIANEDIGDTPTFQIDYKTVLFGATYFIRIFNAVSNKWSMGHKLSDFAMPEYDFDFFANAAQNIGIISLATQA